jgi:hypothetical protein
MRTSLFLLLIGAARVEGQWKLERVGSTAADVDIGWISSIAASRSGELLVADGKLQQIVRYDSLGRRTGVIGRNGRGPLEFTRLSTLAMSADTLVAWDWRERRLTYIGPDGKLVRVTAWSAAELPNRFFSSSGAEVFALAYGRGTQVPIPTPGMKGTRTIRPPKTFLRVSGDVFTTVPVSTRPTVDRVGFECWSDAKGTIYGLDQNPGGDGPNDAFTSGGDFVSLTSDRTRLQWQSAGQPVRSIGDYAPVAVTDRLWAMEATDYLAAAKKEGKPLTCYPEWIRPKTLPPIRAIAGDDAGGIWAEVTTPTEIRYDIYDSTGKLAGSVASPTRRYQGVPFVVRANKLYVVERDADDVLSVTIFRLVKR